MYYFQGQFAAYGRLYSASEHNAEWRHEFAERLKLEARAGLVVVLWVGGQASCLHGDEDNKDLIDELVESGGVAFVSDRKRSQVSGHEIPWNGGVQSMTVTSDGRVSMHWTEGDGGDSFPLPYETLHLLEDRGVSLVHELSAIAKGHLVEEERKADAAREAELERLRNDHTELAFQLRTAEARG